MPNGTDSVLTHYFHMICGVWSIYFTSVLITTSSCLTEYLCSPQIIKSNTLVGFTLKFTAVSAQLTEEETQL